MHKICVDAWVVHGKIIVCIQIEITPIALPLKVATEPMNSRRVVPGVERQLFNMGTELSERLCFLQVECEC